METIDQRASFKEKITLMKQLAYLISLLLLLASTHPAIIEERVESSEEISVSVASSQQRVIQSTSQYKPVISPIRQLPEVAPVSISLENRHQLTSSLYIKHRILRI